MNTLVVHALGGCGINVADKVFTKLELLGEGFCQIEYNYVDTSKVNIDKITPKGDFWLVQTDGYGKEAIHGSGSERRTHAKDIMESMKKYLDKVNLVKNDPSRFHIVVASASGGSGGTGLGFVVKSLLARGIPVIALLVGDSSNAVYAKNTLGTLTTLNKFAIESNKPLPIIYLNNFKIAGTTKMHESIESANKLLFNILTGVSLFLSGDHEFLDNQDMINMIDASRYKTITVKPGLYGLQVGSKELNVPKHMTPILARTLTLPNRDFDTGVSLLHHKHGYITIQNAIDVIKEDNLPIHIYTTNNFFKVEEAALLDVIKNYTNIEKAIVADPIEPSVYSEVDEDTGMVF